MIMNEHVRDWVQALRSGDYKKVRGAMRRRDPATGEVEGYCCLGVACELAGVELVSSGADTEGWVSQPDDIFNTIVQSSLPDWLMELLSVKDADMSGLTHMNDMTDFGFGEDVYSFEQIAEVIETAANDGSYTWEARDKLGYGAP